ncbi:MAG: glutamine amidotransferase [Pelagibacteraceae bacterium]|nr:glutamine amidotransferase [Pelagibacteraceae bacterium]|tara:strand:+ start:10555 stop:11280 length:726 start_codon:yes stop_codon:yes gene_type:complete
MTKNIIILQHIAVETPGYILDLMKRDNYNLTTIELDEGEKIPNNINQFDAMLSMGGPMDTWMEESHPWLIEEKKTIKEFVINLKKPFLGFCLGCQLLGEVVGGKVVKSNPPEIGILDVNMLQNYEKDEIFKEFPSRIKALQWHSYEVQDLEKNCDVSILASSLTTKYQIFKYQNHAYGIQFHIEIKEDTVNKWGCVREYKTALEESLGKDALDQFDTKAKDNIKNFNNSAEILYKNFSKII